MTQREYPQAAWTADPAPCARADQIKTALHHVSAVKPRLNNLYLVKGWLAQGGASVAFGPSNVGKSFWALDLSLCIAAGRDWHGRRVSGGPVIFAVLEGGYGFIHRIEAIRRSDPDLVANAEFYLMTAPINLADPIDVNALIEVLADLTPALIVIDTLARAMQGDENSTQEMGGLIRGVDQIRRQTGAHVMLIHHTGKDTSKGARGSSALRAAVDTEIELRRLGDTITAQTVKQRDMQSGLVFAYRLQEVDIGADQDGEKIASAVVQETDTPSQKPNISGKTKVAFLALTDAIAKHGEKRSGEMFPHNRLCVPAEKWKAFCEDRDLSDSDTPDALRMAFNRAKNKLHENDIIGIEDGFVWVVAK